MDINTINQLSISVLHDDKGAIVHTHHFGTSNNGVHPSQAQQERIVRAVVASRGMRDPDKLSFLDVDPKTFDGTKQYRVDLAAKRLVLK